MAHTIETPPFDNEADGFIPSSNWLEKPVTPAKRQARTMDPVQSFVLRPIQSLVAEPANAPAHETIEFANVSRSRCSVEAIPRRVYMLGR